MKKTQHKLEILFEDEFLLAINKKPGLLSIPDRFKPELPNALATLKAGYESIYTLHRLDKGTSGVLLFAKTAEVHKQLNMAFENRQVRKVYHALSKGTPLEADGIITGPIAPNRSKAGKMMISKSGKPARSHYKILEAYAQYALVEVTLETGRTHQARVHLQSIGMPILGDAMYGPGDFFISELKGKKFRLGKLKEERPILSRAGLHAYTLEFKHPKSKEKIKVQADYPKDFKATLNQIKKWKGA